MTDATRAELERLAREMEEIADYIVVCNQYWKGYVDGVRGAAKRLRGLAAADAVTA